MYDYIRLLEHFKDGDKVVCIDNDGIEDELKTNSIYNVVRFNREVHCISPFSYHPYRFISLKEYRKEKLKEIEECSK